MQSWIRFLAVLALCTNLAWAADASADKLHWRCWYDQQVHITCIVDTVPEKVATFGPMALPANLPPFVMTMRNNPRALRNQIIHIPLHTEPYDMEFTAALAKNSVCGSRQDCSVNFTSKLPPAEEIVALLNKHLPDQGADPATLLALGRIGLDDME